MNCGPCCTTYNTCGDITTAMGQQACFDWDNCGTPLTCADTCTSSSEKCIDKLCRAQGTYDCSTVILILQQSSSFSEATFSSAISSLLGIHPDGISVDNYEVTSQGGLGVQFKLCGSSGTTDTLVSKLLSTPSASFATAGIDLYVSSTPPPQQAPSLVPDEVYITGGSVDVVAATQTTPFNPEGEYTVTLYKGTQTIQQRIFASYQTASRLNFIVPALVEGRYEIEVFETATSVFNARLELEVYSCANDACAECINRPLCSWCGSNAKCFSIYDSNVCDNPATTCAVASEQLSSTTKISVGLLGLLSIVCFFLM